MPSSLPLLAKNMKDESNCIAQETGEFDVATELIQQLLERAILISATAQPMISCTDTDGAAKLM